MEQKERETVIAFVGALGWLALYLDKNPGEMARWVALALIGYGMFRAGVRAGARWFDQGFVFRLYLKKEPDAAINR